MKIVLKRCLQCVIELLINSQGKLRKHTPTVQNGFKYIRVTVRAWNYQNCLGEKKQLRA